MWCNYEIGRSKGNRKVESTQFPEFLSHRDPARDSTSHNGLRISNIYGLGVGDDDKQNIPEQIHSNSRLLLQQVRKGEPSEYK